jgi:hypothetical protein
VHRIFFFVYVHGHKSWILLQVESLFLFYRIKFIYNHPPCRHCTKAVEPCANTPFDICAPAPGPSHMCPVPFFLASRSRPLSLSRFSFPTVPSLSQMFWFSLRFATNPLHYTRLYMPSYSGRTRMCPYGVSFPPIRSGMQPKPQTTHFEPVVLLYS